MSDPYSDRNLLLIYLRGRVHSLYKKAKRISKSISGQEKTQEIKEILIYPPLSEIRKVSDLLNKCKWAFPDNGAYQITLPVCMEENKIQSDYSDLSDSQHPYINHPKHIKLVKWSSSLQSRADRIFIHSAWHLFIMLLRGLLHKTEVIDPRYYSFIESNIWKKYYGTKLLAEDISTLSNKNYESLQLRCEKKDSAYLFLTGPSFDSYQEYEYKNNSLKVVCNSIVKNDEFLEYISGPDIICFADPVFHFSSNRYAHQFRTDVVRVVSKYDCFVVVPEETVGLLLSHYPELRDNIIGVKTVERWNIPSKNKLFVKGTGSVITYLMIPLASSLTNEIFIIGADGRDNREKYFWKHSTNVQYDDLMGSVFNSHPSFFRDRDYFDGYKSHCDEMEGIMVYGERFGIVYQSITNSFIPALRKRLNVNGLFYNK